MDYFSGRWELANDKATQTDEKIWKTSQEESSFCEWIKIWLYTIYKDATTNKREKT